MSRAMAYVFRLCLVITLFISNLIAALYSVTGGDRYDGSYFDFFPPIQIQRKIYKKLKRVKNTFIHCSERSHLELTKSHPELTKSHPEAQKKLASGIPGFVCSSIFFLA